MTRVRFVQMFAVAVFAAVFSTSCGYIFGAGDCGYEARLKRPEGSDRVEIRVHRVNAETVGKVTSCGYSYDHTRAKVDIDGAPLPERVGPTRFSETYVNKNDQGGADYEAPAIFDPRTNVIRIENQNGYRYSSRPETINQQSGGSMIVPLK